MEETITLESPSASHHKGWVKFLTSSGDLDDVNSYRRTAECFDRTVGEVLYATGLTDTTTNDDGTSSRLDLAVFRVSEERGHKSTNVSPGVMGYGSSVLIHNSYPGPI